MLLLFLCWYVYGIVPTAWFLQGSVAEWLLREDYGFKSLQECSYEFLLESAVTIFMVLGSNWIFWCVRTWPYRSKVWTFSIIKPVLFQGLTHQKSRLGWGTVRPQFGSKIWAMSKSDDVSPTPENVVITYTEFIKTKISASVSEHCSLQ